MDRTFKLQIYLQILFLMGFSQVLRDATAVIYGSTLSQRTISPISDANLMFEFLLTGVEIDQDDNIILIDKEMASMRQGRTFLAHINDNIPKTQSSMNELLTTIEGQKKTAIPQMDFESLVLALVYSAHQAGHQQREEEKRAWSKVLLRLANVTINDLRGQYLINYA